MRKTHYIELRHEGYTFMVRVLTIYDPEVQYAKDGHGQDAYLYYDWEFISVRKNNKVIPRPETLTDEIIREIISNELQSGNINYE